MSAHADDVVGPRQRVDSGSDVNGGSQQEESATQRVKRLGSGLALVVFPVMLLAGFLLHPNF